MTAKNQIHPTAVVHPNARIGKNVCIGPGCSIGEHVCIGDDSQLLQHCVVDGHTTIGKRCRLFTGAVVGSIPQDLKYQGEPAQLLIGDDNVIREYATVNIGTGNNGKTVIGDKNLFMAYSHVAHDCRIGSSTVVANSGTFAGHVSVEDKAVIGGMTAVHQFVRIGKLSIIGGCSKVIKDIPPFAMADGHPCRVSGINSIGLQRAQVPPESIRRIKQAFRKLFYSRSNFSQSVQQIRDESDDDPYIADLVGFIEKTERGISSGPRG